MDPHERATSVWYRVAGLLRPTELAIEIVEAEIRSAPHEVLLDAAKLVLTGEAHVGVRSLFYNHPAESPKKGLDVRGPAFRYSAIKFNRDSLPTLFAAPSVKDGFNSSVTGKTLFHRLERSRLITRNDKKIFL